MDSANRTNTIMTLTKEQKQTIEKDFESAMKSLGHTPRSKTYRKFHGLYFSGASKALEAIGYAIPPIWTICLMTGRDIIEESKTTENGETATS